MVRTVAILGASTLLAGLAACGDGGSAVETRDRATEGAPAVLTAISASASDAGREPRSAPEKAETALTANRTETVDQKVVRLFERNGADFGARNPTEYLAKVRTFTSDPPSGTERVQRANGDVLLYQASTNTFAVVSRQGVPKTMFKPADGAAYWAEQKTRAPTFGQRRSSQN